MFTDKLKRLKKASYFCLTLVSTAFPSKTEATSLLKDYVDHPVIGGSVQVPRYDNDRVVKELEKKPELFYEKFDTKNDEVQKDINSPAVDKQHHTYRDTHNAVVDKYSKEHPNLLRHKLTPKKEKQKEGLGTSTHNFLEQAKKLREKCEEENQKLKKTEETLVKGVGYVGEMAIENNVKNPQAKSFFLDILNQTLSLLSR
jgi:hypothetical protein